MLIIRGTMAMCLCANIPLLIFQFSMAEVKSLCIARKLTIQPPDAASINFGLTLVCENKLKYAI